MANILINLQNISINIAENLNLNSSLAFMWVFLGGVIISFTPCIYPLIPVTVSLIGAKSSGSRLKGFLLSLVYVLGMAIVYSILGAITSLFGVVLGSLINTPVAYCIIGIIFLVFGLSMLGIYNMPILKILSKPDTKKGGFGQALVLGFVSGLVAGPCATPVLGAILVFVAAKQNILYGTTLLFVFACGMGTLLILVGTFTGLLVAIPKSGLWMERIKKFCGIILILFSAYFFIKMGGLL